VTAVGPATAMGPETRPAVRARTWHLVLDAKAGAEAFLLLVEAGELMPDCGTFYSDPTLSANVNNCSSEFSLTVSSAYA